MKAIFLLFFDIFKCDNVECENKIEAEKLNNPIDGDDNFWKCVKSANARRINCKGEFPKEKYRELVHIFRENC